MQTRACVVAGLTILLLTGAAGWPEWRSLEAVLIVNTLPGERIRVIADVPGRKRVEMILEVEAGGKLTLSDNISHGKVTLSGLSLDLPDEKAPAPTPISLEEAVQTARRLRK